MPELPEVERARSSLDKIAKNATITNVKAREDNKVFQGCTASEFEESLLHKKVIQVDRRGKYFYLVLSSPPHPIFHFGMSGSSATKGEAPLEYRTARTKDKDDKKPATESEWPPPYWKFVLEFSNGKEWAYCDTRRLGRVSLIDSKSPLDIPPLSILGNDPYLNMPDLATLSTALLSRTAPIKAVLLDQNGPIAGLGNWMVDEILFGAKVHPAQKSNTLESDQLEDIHSQIQQVTNHAVKVNADPNQFPSTWLFFHRWSKRESKSPNSSSSLPDFIMENGQKAKIKYETVGGRTTAIVTNVQIMRMSSVKNKKRKKISSSPEPDKKTTMVEGQEKKQDAKKEEGAETISTSTASLRRSRRRTKN